MSRPPKAGPPPIEQALAKVQGILDALWTNLAPIDGPGAERIVFVGPNHGAGTTTLATATALGLARRESEFVSLIEANCFSPGMAGYLDLPPSPGFTDVLAQKASEEEAVRNSMVPGLRVLTAGTPRRIAAGELASRAARELIEHASHSHPYTIIDAPPLLDHPVDARHFLSFATRAVLVLRARKTAKADAKAAIRMIKQSGVPFAGTILNRFRSDLPFGIGEGWRG